MNTQERIEAAKSNLNKAEKAKLQAETQKEHAEKQLEEVKQKMAVAGVTPENIESTIQELDESIKKDLEKIENLIPQV
ncbi:hypothetical protein RJD11_12295 [Bacillus velezensis]|uniref:hypothetical protein n=1 Tax=Bacillus TaxID=1386 RepID=UPI001C52ECD4|nr:MULTISPECIES: hypothetical protein [Bacillus amyloliquefaciens group]QXP95493.1 hypothetical protein KVY05_11885 [Bacillus velezensis]QXP99287.1 hypothetical protein KVY05_21215 [Bacillus velezensis]UHH01373.1 hypothetical protein LUA14_12220 [Bacillus amyloliquefaciens]ULR21120.1 hypothetical protein MJE83_12215 [Bacillus velezensis]UVW07863.1 hypothetical protein NX856_12255 [Bacillus velezensis]